MTATESATGLAYDRRRELQAFDETKAGVKGLVDAGVTALPPIFRHPPEALEGIASPTGDVAAIPTVDLAAARREDAVALVRHAAATVGFFEVVNHGVPAELMAGMLAGVRRFNEGPAEAKRALYTRDQACKVRFSSNFDLFQSAAANWRDTLFFGLAPDPPPPEELPEAVRYIRTNTAAYIPDHGRFLARTCTCMIDMKQKWIGTW
jgi:2,4-dihydroxy-1,4-benzoxazin-3-one-glucoside dioxygenase